MALHKETAYVALPDRVLAVDTASGAVTTAATSEAEPLVKLTPNLENNLPAPFVTEAVSPLVLTTFFVHQPGAGTQAPRVFMEFTAIPTAKGAAPWRLPLELPQWAKESQSPVTATVVGASGKVAVLTLSTTRSMSSSGATTYAVDLDSHRVLWTKDLFRAASVTGGIVTGEERDKNDSDYSAAAGYDLATATEKWRAEDRTNLDVMPAGPHLILATAVDKSDFRIHYRQLLDPATGQVKRDLPDDLPGSDCAHDGTSTLVCAGHGPEFYIWAVDDTSAALRWQLPDKNAGRIAPQVTAVWHGLIYAKANDGPLTLDARTGADLPTRPGIAPYLVNEYTGLALSDDRALTAYPTNG
ncbi:hypothetical protein OV450_3010 [Actinobacteria bacterium OV450]|nr:hypothetical protein OV450_3010 [Actinobacteria bacterium OV450]